MSQLNLRGMQDELTKNKIVVSDNADLAASVDSLQKRYTTYFADKEEKNKQAWLDEINTTGDPQKSI